MLISILEDSIHILKVLFCCELFFAFERRGKKHLMILASILSLISIVHISSSANEVIDLLVYIIIMFLLVCCFYKEKILNLLIFTFWLIFVFSMVDMIANVFVETILNLSKAEHYEFFRIVESALSFLFVIIVGKMYDKKYKIRLSNIKTIYFFFFTILILTNTFIVLIIAATTLREQQEKKNILFPIVFILVILGIFFQLATVILLYMQKNIYKEKEELTEKYLNDQINHYEYLEKREKETKKFRHDLRSHMQLLANMVANKEYQKFEGYLKELDIKIESFANVVTVHNGIVDAILNQYYAKAMQTGVDFRIIGMIPQHCDIEPYDLCTIVSNVISNAFEATMEAEEKSVVFECRYNENNIILTIKNSFLDVGQFKNGIIKTRKKEIDYHGYGLENIKDSVEKYNGIMDLDIENNQFKMKILLHCDCSGMVD